MALTKVTFSMIEGMIVNAKDYGAVGDGTTDDSVAIQAAVDATPDGGTLWIDDVYLVQGVKIEKSINIIGDNNGGFKAKTTSGGGYATSNNIFYTDTSNTIQKIVFHNLTFDGSSTGYVSGVRNALVKTFNVPQVQFTDCFVTKHSASDVGITDVISEHYDLSAIAIWYSKEVLAENNRFLDNYSEKLWIQGAIAYFTNVSVRFNHWEAGSVLGASSLDCIRCSGVIDNNYSDYQAGSAMNVLGAKDMTVSNNIISRCTTSWGLDFVEGGIYTADNVVIQNNNIYKCAYGISVWGNNIHILDNTLENITNANDGISCIGVTDAGNSIYYSAAEIAAGLLPSAQNYYGLWVKGNYCNNIKVTSPATVNNPYWLGVGVANKSYTWSDVYIEDNVFECRDGSYSLSTPIVLTNVWNSQIRNNSMRDFTYNAISQQLRSGTTFGIDSLVIDGNRIDNRSATEQVIYVNLLTTGGENLVRVTNNNFVSSPATGKYKVFCNYVFSLIYENNAGTGLRLRDYVDYSSSIVYLTYQNPVVYRTAAPNNGTWAVTDVVLNSTPTAGQPKGWVCTVAGAPGTWVSLGNL